MKSRKFIEGHEMLTGELPVGKFAPPSACKRGEQVDARLDEVVLRALEKEPERRYQQADEVKTAVETIGSTKTPRGPAKEAEMKSRIKRRKLIGIGATIVVLVAAAAFVEFRFQTIRRSLEFGPLWLSDRGLVRQFVALRDNESSANDIKLIDFAKEAARRGDGGLVRRALMSITAIQSRDEAAIVCACVLVDRGQRADASKVAEMISRADCRNNITAQLGELSAEALKEPPLKSPPPSPDAQARSNELAGRLITVKNLESWTTRDMALAELAKDAARAGDGGQVRLALEMIIPASTRDDAAIVCSRLLVQGGQRAAAKKVASIVSWPETRRNLVAQLDELPEAPLETQSAKTPLTGKAMELARELERLKALESSGNRDDRLVDFSKEAARAGEAGLVRAALDAIGSAMPRDEAAVVCARLLAQAGKRSEAVNLAKTITWPPNRKNVLEQIDELPEERLEVQAAGIPPTGNAKELARQFDRLKARDASSARDGELIDFSKAAARAGEAGLVRLALDTIMTKEPRDEAAMVCARLLAQAGKRTEAVNTAKIITWPPNRKNALAQLNELPEETLETQAADILPTGKAKELAEQFDRLKAIGASSTRDVSLIDFSKEAARAGEARLVELALDAIIPAQSRDEAALVCVRLLAQAGQHSEAVKTARLLTWPEHRKNMLAQLNEPALNIPSSNLRPAHLTPSRKGDLAEEFGRLKKIEAVSQRDEALARFAQEAARAGDVEMVGFALDTIIPLFVRDNAAKACIPLLVEAGQRTGAIEVVASISSPSVRDSTLSGLSGKQ